jgi:hypothetical protein
MIYEFCIIFILYVSFYFYSRKKKEKKIDEKIHVKNCFGETFAMKVREHDTISSIKDRIFKKHNIPRDQHNIMFSGKKLINLFVLIKPN